MFNCKKNQKQSATLFVVVFIFLLSACTGIPKNVKPVADFELTNYLGQWYEIARLDHSFERGLSNVTAHYALSDDGGVIVTNKGFNRENNEWQQAIGKAYFVDSTDIGYLKVSFFGPFYGSYIVFELVEQGEKYSFVSGPDYSYLWLLSRTPTINESVINRFREQATLLGFNTDELIMVDQAINKQNMTADNYND